MVDRVPPFCPREGRALLLGPDKYVEIGRMWLDPPRGLMLRRVRLFRKGVVDAAFFEADSIRVTFGLPGRESGWVKGVTIVDGRLRSERASRSACDGTDPPAGPEAERMVRLRLIRFDLAGIWLPDVRCEVFSGGGSLRLEGIAGVVGKGAAHGPVTGRFRFQQGTCEYEGNLVSFFDPVELVDYLRQIDLTGLVHFIEAFSFEKSGPRMAAEFSGRLGPAWRLDVDGRFRTAEATYNGVPLAAGDADVHLDLRHNRARVTLDPLDVYRREGSARVRLLVDLMDRTVRFSGSSSLAPEALAQLIFPSGPEAIRDFRMTPCA